MFLAAALSYIYWMDFPNNIDSAIRYIRLEDDVCEVINRMAQDEKQRPSEIVNRILRESLTAAPQPPGRRDSD